MIDILLVLIIAFMVITPTKSRGLNALVPQPAPSGATDDPARISDIVVTVLGGDHYQLNSESLDLAGLGRRLAALFHGGSSQAVFVRGDKELDYGQIARVNRCGARRGCQPCGINEQLALL